MTIKYLPCSGQQDSFVPSMVMSIKEGRKSVRVTFYDLHYLTEHLTFLINTLAYITSRQVNDVNLSISALVVTCLNN